MLAKCGLPPELSGCQQHPLASHVGCVDPTIPQSILLPAATDAQVGSVAVATDRVATNRAEEVRKDGMFKSHLHSHHIILASASKYQIFSGAVPEDTREEGRRRDRDFDRQT